MCNIIEIYWDLSLSEPLMRVIVLITLMPKPHHVIARHEAISELGMAGHCLNRDLWDSRMARMPNPPPPRHCEVRSNLRTVNGGVLSEPLMRVIILITLMPKPHHVIAWTG